MCTPKRQSTPPPANTITILAADLLATRAGQLLEALAFGNWEPALKLKESLQVYTEVRLGTALSEQADLVLQHIDANEKAPPTERSVHHA